MTGTLNNAVPATDLGYKNIVQCFRKTITFSNNGTAITIGKLPAGACVVGGGALVTTAFNDSGTDIIDIGTSDDANAYATDLDVSSVGYKILDELAAHDDYSAAAEVTITATYTGQNSNMTAGSADIMVFWVAK